MSNFKTKTASDLCLQSACDIYRQTFLNCESIYAVNSKCADSLAVTTFCPTLLPDCGPPIFRLILKSSTLPYSAMQYILGEMLTMNCLDHHTHTHTVKWASCDDAASTMKQLRYKTTHRMTRSSYITWTRTVDSKDTTNSVRLIDWVRLNVAPNTL